MFNVALRIIALFGCHAGSFELGLLEAIDCTDQKANPEIRKIAKQISGEEVTTRDRMVIKCDTANGLDIGMVCS